MGAARTLVADGEHEVGVLHKKTERQPRENSWRAAEQSAHRPGDDARAATRKWGSDSATGTTWEPLARSSRMESMKWGCYTKKQNVSLAKTHGARRSRVHTDLVTMHARQHASGAATPRRGRHGSRSHARRGWRA